MKHKRLLSESGYIKKYDLQWQMWSFITVSLVSHSIGGEKAQNAGI